MLRVVTNAAHDFSINPKTSTKTSATSSWGNSWTTKNLVINTVGKLDELFLLWVSSPSTQQQVKKLLATMTSSQPKSILSSPVSSTTPQSSSPIKPRSLFGEANKENLNPNQSKPKQIKEKSLPIPQFYQPASEAQIKEKLDKEFSQLRNYFGNGTISEEKFTAGLQSVCNFSTFLSTTLFAKLDIARKGSVQFEIFASWWKVNITNLDLNARVFSVLRKSKTSRQLSPNDFRPLVKEVLRLHPGIQFLCTDDQSGEFKDRYVDTVVVLIFYFVCKSKGKLITVKDLQKANFGQILNELENEAEINNIPIFSYQNFYVIYCEFYDYDTDHDLYISKDELRRYHRLQDPYLSRRAVDRIFLSTPFPDVPLSRGRISYQDFVWYILSEEDKTTEASLEYWFRCLDMDGDGVVSAYEFEYFYEEQCSRMEDRGIEPVSFVDMYCQLLDMINPVDRNRITLKDIKNCKMGEYIFNLCFNVTKFLQSEQKDPFAQNSGMTPWEKFASEEYTRLFEENKQDDNDEDEEEEDEDSDYDDDL